MHLQEHDLWLLLPSLFIIGVSIVFFFYKKHTPAILLLGLGGMGLFFFMAQIDHFLWDWDEKYHALVAQHLRLHPLKPTLYEDTLMGFDYKVWISNHVWLHKPPLALWQMAICSAIFGTSEFAIRIPSVLLGTALILVIFRMGSLYLTKRTGFLAALLWTFSWFTLNMMSGNEGMGGIDITFAAYITFSFWSWMEYKKSGRKIFLILTGLFSGMAVLTKLTVGLLVFASWGMSILFSRSERKSRKAYLDFLTSLVVSIVVFMPWQIHIFSAFPLEAAYEANYSRRHLFEAVEGHGGDVWFYFNNLRFTFGNASVYFIFPAIYFLFKGIVNKQVRIFVLANIVITFLFFTLAATKIAAFCFIVSPLIFLAFGALLDFTFDKLYAFLNNRIAIFMQAICIACVCYFSMNIKQLKAQHTEAGDSENKYRINKTVATKYYKKLGETIPPRSCVFGNPCLDCQVEMMFYAGAGTTAYLYYPDSLQYVKVKNEQRKMFAFHSKDLPSFLEKDPNVVKLDFKY